MLKRIGLLFLVFLLISPCFSQSIIDIEVKNYGIINTYSSIPTFVVNSLWIPYLDGERIREYDFYKITGDAISASADLERRNKARLYGWTGGGAFFLGLTGLLAIALSSYGEVPFNELPPEILAGTIGSTIAFGGGLVVFLLADRYTGNTRPVSYALRLAQEYNERQ